MVITVNFYDSSAARPSEATSSDARMALDAGASPALGSTEVPDAAALAQVFGRAIDAGPPSAELVQVVEDALAGVRATTTDRTASLGGISGGSAPA